MSGNINQFALSVLINAVQVFALFYLAYCPGGHKAFRWWGYAFAIQLARKFLFPLEMYFPGHSEWVSVWFILPTALAIWIGTKMLLDQPVSKKPLIYLLGIFFVWSAGSHVLYMNRLLTEIPIIIVCCAIIFASAFLFLKNRPKDEMSGYSLAFFGLILSGLQLATYPWRYHFEWYPAIGYLLSTVITMLQAFAIVIVAGRREASANMALTKQIRESEAAYREMLDNLPDGVYQASIDGRILRVNSALVKVMGYDTVAEYMQAVEKFNTTDIYVQPGRREEFRDLATRLPLVENFESQIYRHRTGEVIWIAETGRAVRDERGEVRYFEGTIRDITQAKQNEEAKELGEAKLASIMEHAPFGLFLKAPDGTYLAANMTSLIGKRDQDILPNDEVQRIKMEEEKVLRTAQPVYSERSSMDGLNPKWSMIVRFPVRGLNGRIIAIGGFEIDITKQKSAELELIAARDQATTANKAKSAFLANMSHELRTPLNAVIGFAEVLSSETFGTLNERQKSYLNDIHQAGAHLLDVINDILDMSRIESGKMEINAEIVEPGELVQTCLHIVREKIIANNQQLQFSWSMDLPKLYVDRRAIKQVLINLLSNAVKFTPPNGSITVSMYHYPLGDFHIVVADSGIGIAPEALGFVMEPFRQADPSIAKRYEGSGLGLPISKRLMELHGGMLKVDSILGKGTTVTMSIPQDRVILAENDEDQEFYQQKLEESRNAATL